MPSETLKSLVEKYGLIMNQQEVAKELNCTSPTVVQMIARKQIIGRKSGRTWIIATENFEKYITTAYEPSEPTYSKPKGVRRIV